MRSFSPSLPTAFCFGGQGSQYHHMAADLMGTHPVFRQWMEVGDQIIHNLHGFSPLEKIYAAERTLSDPFDHLEHSHPALFMTQFALAKLLQNKGIRPDMLVGVSLGEFVAMSISGMVPFETALKTIAHQPSLFRKQAPHGALIAVLASQDRLAASKTLQHISEFAGINAAQHCVLACLETDTKQVLSALRQLGVSFQKLPVPFAFHSRWIEPARQDYLQSVRDLTFETPFWPVWSSCLGAPLDTVDGALTWQIVRAPMHLRATFDAIEARGGANYIDLSPTGSLAAILRQELSENSPSTATALLSPFGGDLKRLEGFIQGYRSSHRINRTGKV